MLELQQVNVSTLVKFKYKSLALKLNEPLTNKNYFQCPLYKVRQPSKLKVRFILRCDQYGERGGANLPHKGP